MPQKLSKNIPIQNSKLLAPSASFEIISAAGASHEMEIDTGNAILEPIDVIFDLTTPAKSGIYIYIFIHSL
jgi:hypothetical protein